MPVPNTPTKIRRSNSLDFILDGMGYTGMRVYVEGDPPTVQVDPGNSAAVAAVAAHDWTEPASGETVTAVNKLVSITITPGMPVRIQTTGTGSTVDVQRSRALGTSQAVARHIGLAAKSIAPSASGSVILSGPLDLTTAEWDAVTGETGGLVRGNEYYLDDLFGRLTRTPQPAAASVSLTNADGSYTGPRSVMSVGIALTSTVMEVRYGGAECEVAMHAGEADPHPQYLTQSEANALYAQDGHTHTLSALTQSGATAGQVPTWNGAEWVPQTPSVGGGGGGLSFGVALLISSLRL